MEGRAMAIKKAIEELISQPGDHACRNDPDGICPVISVVSDDLVFVEKPSGKYCPYYAPFGHSGFCNFSARKELYNTYRV
jgi:hypothetical protein